MDTIGIAVIGCGPMGQSLAVQAATIEDVNVVALADVDQAKAEEVRAELGTGAVVPPEKVLEMDEVDAVVVATPGWTHSDIVVEAFSAGKHVFVEKPMALANEDCVRMIEAGKSAGKKLMVGQVLRYYTPFVHIGEMRKAGKLGEISAVRITRTGFGWGGWLRPWRTKASQCGGVLFEFSVHEMDFMMSLVGDAAVVHAFANHTVIKEVDYPDMIGVNIQFASGAIGQMNAGIADRVGTYNGEIIGTEGTVHFNSRKSEIITRFGNDEPETIPYADLADREQPVRRELREFVEAVVNDTPVTIPGEEGYRVVRVANAAVASSARGEVIPLVRP